MFSKNNMGIIITLILVILISQSRFFDFYFDTYLGRAFLLAFVIFVAYTNKILGLLAVLAIIIAFNQNEMNVVQSYNYFEGFENGNTTATPATTTAHTANNDKKKEEHKRLEEHRKKLEEHRKKLEEQKKKNDKKQTQEAREGFCMSDREINMLRGKQSNAVPVFNDSRNQLDDVSPTDKSIFSSSFASF